MLLTVHAMMEFDIAREMQKPVYRIPLGRRDGARSGEAPTEKAGRTRSHSPSTCPSSGRPGHEQASTTLSRVPPDLRQLVAAIPCVARGFPRRHLPHRQIRSGGTHRPRGGTEAPQRRLGKARSGRNRAPHVLTFVALGGEGKTSLVAKWAAELAHQDWPGCDAVFAWSFYSQGTREQTAASSDLFLKEALTFFGDAAMAGSAQGAFDKGRRLAQLVGERRALLILDGLEPLQYAPTSPTPGELKDQGIAALLKGLAATSHGLCVVTTRYSIPDLRAYWQTTAPEVKLARLSREAGVALLQSLGVKGHAARSSRALVEDVKGHALTLNLLGSLPARRPRRGHPQARPREAGGSRRRRTGRPRLPRHGCVRAVVRERRRRRRASAPSPSCGCSACSTGPRPPTACTRCWKRPPSPA